MRSGSRALSATILLGGLLAPGGAARAQGVEAFYRGRAIEIIVGYPTGASNDVYARALAQRMGAHIPGKPSIIVRNMPGAGSFLAANYMTSQAPRDGTSIGMIAPTAPLDVAECTQALEAAKRERERLTLRAEEVARAEEWATKARGDVEAKNLEAARLRETAPETVDAGPLEEEATRRAKAVVRLRAELAEAEAHAFQSAGALSEALRVNRERERTFQAASEREAFADALHAQLGVMPAAVTQAEVNGAQASVTAANVLLAQAKGQEALRKQLADAAALRAVAEADAALAAKLDGVVIDLTNEAPKSLAMVDAIPGLALNGERVTLDGKDLDALSGAEQMRFAVEVARRANAKSKIIVVDGLERIDPEQYAAFVQQATAGGFQLFGTRVAGGGLELEAVG